MMGKDRTSLGVIKANLYRRVVEALRQ
jgi:hypothetical protein